MKFFSLATLAGMACIAASAGSASACQCGATNYYGQNNWQVAELEAKGATVIFEGVAVRIENTWNILKAKDGERVSANEFSPTKYQSAMLVTFRVLRAYKGELGTEIGINTGFGGGDCGAVYAPGVTYLIFANGTGAQHFGVGMCSPGGWIAGDDVAPQLRYLRKEPPIASDLIPRRRQTPAEHEAEQEQRHRDSADFQKRWAEVTGEICGTTSEEKPDDSSPGVIEFLSTAGYSPIDHPTVYVNRDGSFCSERLGPGKYYLYFRKGSAATSSAVYYPGVGDRAKATAVEIGEGQTKSGLIFKIPRQKKYSVQGIISANEKLGFDLQGAELLLISLDGAPYSGWYRQQVDFQRTFLFSKLKYFDLEDVLPGRYLAFVSVDGRDWFTYKDEVNVTDHMEFVSLRLEHEKQTEPNALPSR
jgi:hypothetical protein